MFILSRLHRLLLIVLIQITSNCLLSQNTVIKHYGVNKGLPSSETYFVTQDSKGYLWIASDAGVIKYDGYKFITYTTNNGLPDNTVFKIHEDRYGKIWFSTYSGRFAYYNHKTDSIYEIKANAKLVKDVKTFPIDFVFDSADTLFICTDKKGIIKVFPPYYNEIESHKYSINCLYLKKVDEGKYIYGKNFINDVPSTNAVPLVYDDKNDYSLKSTDTTFLVDKFGSHTSFSSSNKNVYLSTGSCVFELLNGKFSKKFGVTDIGLAGANIVTINLDRKNQLWLNLLNQGTALLHKDKQFKVSSNYFSGLTVTSVFQDNLNGIWCSTLEDGVFYIPTLDFKFYNTQNGFSAEKIHALTKWQGNLLSIASDGTFNEFNFSTKKIINYKLNEYTIWNFKSLANVLAVSGSPSYVYGKDYKKGKSIFIYENGVKHFLRLKDIEDIDNESFLGSEDGFLYKISKISAEAVLVTENLPMIFSICKVGDKIYLGTKTGLYSYQNNRLNFLGNINSKLKYRIDDMVYNNGLLFLATKGYGVIVLKNEQIVAHFTERDGLASNITKYFALDSNNDIWIGTNKGISRLHKNNTDNYKINTINLSEGIVSNEINQLLVNDSVLYFATNKGLGEIKIKDAFSEGFHIPTYIESFTINGTKFNYDTLQSLSYNQNIIQIAYKGINVKSEGEILYKYHLNGLDTNWTYTKNTFVQFTTLPPGNYRFEVYALNSDGQICDKPAVISFSIEAPFWQKWWFIVLLITLSGIVLYIIVIQRVKVIKQKEEEKTIFNKKLADSELKALRAQMNPHFIFNAINSIQSFVLKNESKSAQKYLTKFARLIRSVLENSKHELVLLSKEIEALELYIELEVLRASFSFDYEIVLEDSMHADHFYIPPMIIQPYVENAILHGLTPLKERRGKLTLTFSQKGNILNCIIDDNGIGRERALEIKQRKDLGRQSLGMEVTQSRIEMLNLQNNLYTKINVVDKFDNNVATGTTIEINIEIKKKKND